MPPAKPNAACFAFAVLAAATASQAQGDVVKDAEVSAMRFLRRRAPSKLVSGVKNLAARFKPRGVKKAFWDPLPPAYRDASDKDLFVSAISREGKLHGIPLVIEKPKVDNTLVLRDIVVVSFFCDPAPIVRAYGRGVRKGYALDRSKKEKVKSSFGMARIGGRFFIIRRHWAGGKNWRLDRDGVSVGGEQLFGHKLFPGSVSVQGALELVEELGAIRWDSNSTSVSKSEREKTLREELKETVVGDAGFVLDVKTSSYSNETVVRVASGYRDVILSVADPGEMVLALEKGDDVVFRGKLVSHTQSTLTLSAEAIELRDPSR